MTVLLENLLGFSSRCDTNQPSDLRAILHVANLFNLTFDNQLLGIIFICWRPEKRFHVKVSRFGNRMEKKRKTVIRYIVVA